MKKYLKLNPEIQFIPFLILFIIIIINFSTNQLQGDENRYYEFAKNLINGFYSTQAPNINLWNGPGYPIFIMPFVWLELPYICIKLINAFLQYFSIILLFYSISSCTSRTYALIFSYSWALYYLSYQELPYILTETFTSFLITLILFFLVKVNSNNLKNNYYIFFTGIFMGILSLTKIIFGYVLIVLLLIYLLLLVFRSTRNEGHKGALIIIAALMINVPYLIYTYSLTGKYLYWGNSGGSSLYWMSTPVEGEFGEWNNFNFTANCGNDINIPCNANSFKKNHQTVAEAIIQLPAIAQDDELKRIAINNILSHPIKYVRNWISNISRLLYGIPNSYFYQREQTIWRIIPNSLILIALFYSTIISVYNYKNIKFENRFIINTVGVYLFISSLVSAYPRQFNIIVPFLFFWFSFILYKTINLNYKINK